MELLAAFQAQVRFAPLSFPAAHPKLGHDRTTYVLFDEAVYNLVATGAIPFEGRASTPLERIRKPPHSGRLACIVHHPAGVQLQPGRVYPFLLMVEFLPGGYPVLAVLLNVWPAAHPAEPSEADVAYWAALDAAAEAALEPAEDELVYWAALDEAARAHREPSEDDLAYWAALDAYAAAVLEPSEDDLAYWAALDAAAEAALEPSEVDLVC